jgi:hypothetical protein
MSLYSITLFIQPPNETCHLGHSGYLAGMPHRHVMSSSLLSLWTNIIGNRWLRFLLLIGRSMVLIASLMRVSSTLWISLGFIIPATSNVDTLRSYGIEFLGYFLTDLMFMNSHEGLKESPYTNRTHSCSNGQP